MRALVSGVTGMDGYHLAEQLLADGHEVYGLVRGQKEPDVPGVKVARGDLLDQASLCRAVSEADPEVVYHLAAMTSIGMAWGQPALMSDVTGLGVLRMLEAVRLVDPRIRFVHASSADIFGAATESPQRETTPFRPNSPYGAAKLYGHQVVVAYREAYGMHASNMVMFNHSSPRHGTEFVVRRVTRAAARIARGAQSELVLGSLDARRDWGWAPDYMRAWPLAAGKGEPGDYVLATGVSHSLAELCEVAFRAASLNWRNYVRVDTGTARPADVADKVGDAGKAARELGWCPEVNFEQMVTAMVRHDLGAPC